MYVVRLVSPVTVVLVTGVVRTMVRTVAPPMRTRMVDPVMGEPPFAPGVQVRFTVPLAAPRVAVTTVGAAGAVSGAVGVTALDWAEYGPAPNRLLARTWKVYVVPLVKPVTTQLTAVRETPVTVLTTVVPELTWMS